MILANAHDMSQNLTSEWIFLNKQKSIIDEFVCFIRWKTATGTTLNGTLVLELLFGDNETEDDDTLDTIEITTEAGKESRSNLIDCVAVRVIYTANDIASGELTVTLFNSGK